MLAISDFVDAAGMPVKWQERDLQLYLMRCLEDRGFQVKDEVKINGGRADIVSDYLGNSIIEVKKHLDRDTIYQAVGQLHLYGLGNVRQLVIMGFLTSDFNKRESALTTASMIQQDTRYSVIFVNVEKEWYPGTSRSRSSPIQWNFNLSALSRNFSWLKNPLPVHKILFTTLLLLYKFLKANPFPTLLVLIVLYALTTSPNSQQSIDQKNTHPTIHGSQDLRNKAGFPSGTISLQHYTTS